MNINLIVIGKTDQAAIKTLIADYKKRINHFAKFSILEIPDVRVSKKTSTKEQKRLEAKELEKYIDKSHITILLDEKGKEYTSQQFAQLLQKQMNTGIKTLNFIIGGPFGFDQRFYDAKYPQLAFSKMTFSHQMIRIFVTEQIYRGFAILNNLPYHHN